MNQETNDPPPLPSSPASIASDGPKRQRMVPNPFTPNSTKYANDEQMNSAADPQLFHKPATQYKHMLWDQNIVVRVERDGKIHYAEMAVSALVPDTHESKVVDVRCNHLSWEAFRQLLEDLGHGLNFKRHVLGYTADGRAEEIDTESKFRRAISILQGQSMHSQGKDVPGMLLTIKDRKGDGEEGGQSLVMGRGVMKNGPFCAKMLA